MPQAPAQSVDRAAARDRFRRARARTRALFDLLDPAAYYERPIRLRNPVVFYEGHLPAFAVNTLLKKGLGQPGIDAHLETIFARGIDPAEEAAAVARGNPAWPSRDAVQGYAAEADRRLLDAIEHATLERHDHPLLRRAQALWTILEHEEMHQETLAYIWHEAPYAWKRKPEHYVTAPPRLRQAPQPARVRIPAGLAMLGTDLEQVRLEPDTTYTPPFAWDNELPPQQVEVPAFEIDVYNVTNAEYLRFVEETGAAAPHFWLREGDRWLWRGMFEAVPLPMSWPVYVTWDEANAYAAWLGMRLMTEAEFHRAAYGDAGRLKAAPTYVGAGFSRPNLPGNFDFRRWDPEPVGSHPDGASAFGVHDLVGNGWEWTGDVFAPFPGFEPMASYPEYSAEFFDGQHYVMKGASPMTARALTRPGFRNWFRPGYPYVYATFRCVNGM